VGFKITSFDGTNLPTALGDSGSMDLSSGAALSPIISLPGGHVYDAWGASQSPRPSVRLPYSCLLTGTESAMQTALNTWYAKVGKRGSLVRTGGDAATHSVTARLVSVDITRGKAHYHHLPIALAFDVILPWKGAASTNTVGPAATPLTLEPVHGGNALVTNPIFTITAPGGAAVTGVSIQHADGGYYIKWTGTLAATKQLIIDCGAMSVHNDGADAYSGFSFDATHIHDEWMVVKVSPAQDIYVAFTGAATATAKIDFYDGWA
jgi:hypothetical protein